MFIGYFMIGKYKNKLSYSIFKHTHFSKKHPGWVIGQLPVFMTKSYLFKHRTCYCFNQSFRTSNSLL